MRVFRPTSDSELSEWLSDHRDEIRHDLLVTGSVPDRRRSGVDPLPDLAVSTVDLSQVGELRPADLTMEVGAGVRVSEVRRRVAGEGLWLPLLDDAGDRSIGGLVSEAPTSPFDRAYGPVRRHVLACTMVLYDGRVTRWGRPVMKNVAGYDVPRLVCGSRARLGIVTSVTLRLWPRPGRIRRYRLLGTDRRELESPRMPRLEGLVAQGSPATNEVEAMATLAGGEDSTERRAGELREWAATHGFDIDELDDPDDRGDPTSTGAGRRDRTGAVYRITFGRHYLAAGRESVGRFLESVPGSSRVQSFPAVGVVRVAVDGQDPAGQRRAPAWLTGIVEPTDGGMGAARIGARARLRVVRGGPAEHAAAQRLRSATSRHLEERLVAAFGGRDVTWQADYL